MSVATRTDTVTATVTEVETGQIEVVETAIISVAGTVRQTVEAMTAIVEGGVTGEIGAGLEIAMQTGPDPPTGGAIAAGMTET